MSPNKYYQQEKEIGTYSKIMFQYVSNHRSERLCAILKLAMMTKSVYIRPYPDTCFGHPYVFRGVWILWLVHLLLKVCQLLKQSVFNIMTFLPQVLCKDSEWGLFLITTGLLVLFSVQFFIVSFTFLPELSQLISGVDKGGAGGGDQAPRHLHAEGEEGVIS